MSAFEQLDALRVVRGRPTDDELVALVTALYALCNTPDEPDRGAEPIRLRGRRPRYQAAPSWRSRAAS